ncbi:MAG: asparagine synthase-related protein [Bacteroidales bacterium]|nr:asparagine synthase-related protein [Bacteroidales bacterium]
MSGIFGYINRDGNPVSQRALEKMHRIMTKWGPDGCNILSVGSVGFGQASLFTTPKSRFDHIPGRFQLPFSDKDGTIFFTAAGRLDNRKDLIRQLGIEDQQNSLSDEELILQSYLKWGENCPIRIYGDWSFAVWNSKEHKLFLSRDHIGNTSIYYYIDSHTFAFASSRQALLDLDLAPIKMDELYLAQVLVAWPAYQGECTIHSPVKRLPPAHSLTITPDHRIDVRQYWHLEETRTLHLRRRMDYVDTFKEIFDEAVRCRLCSNTAIGASLSGGLDSGSVVSTAANFLKMENKSLLAFTSLPMQDTESKFGDEYQLTQATAKYAGNINLHKIMADTISPIQVLRRMLPIYNEPIHATGNLFWIQGIRTAALDYGCRVFLTGQMGNAGISWAGSFFSQPLAFQLRHFGLLGWSKEFAKQYMPVSIQRWRKYRDTQGWEHKLSLVHPDLLCRLNLKDRMLNDHSLYPITPLEHRYGIIHAGRTIIGSQHAEIGAAWGIEVRDPTADVRLLDFALSVPDRFYMDSGTGMDRWLIREAMKERLPDEVRLNRRRIFQSGDLALRFRISANEVEIALDELSSGPAAAFVNVSYLRNIWSVIRTGGGIKGSFRYGFHLSRGIMAGLWINEFYRVH